MTEDFLSIGIQSLDPLNNALAAKQQLSQGIVYYFSQKVVNASRRFVVKFK